MIRRHEKLFGERPVVLAADKGFCPEKSKLQELAKLVKNLAIPRRMQDFMNKLLAHNQAFRAGIEGTISGLKRAFRGFRCFFRGFKGFARNVGLGVFYHNLTCRRNASAADKRNERQRGITMTHVATLCADTSIIGDFWLSRSPHRADLPAEVAATILRPPSSSRHATPNRPSATKTN